MMLASRTGSQCLGSTCVSRRHAFARAAGDRDRRLRHFARPLVKLHPSNLLPCRVAAPQRSEVESEGGRVSPDLIRKLDASVVKSFLSDVEEQEEEDAALKSFVDDVEEEGMVKSFISDVEEEEGECPVFIDRDGNLVEVMCCDYGFRTGQSRLYQTGYGQIPKSAWSLGWDNFSLEWQQLRRSFRYDQYNKISALNPPRGPFGQVFAKVGASIVRLFSYIDEKLVERRVFSALLPEAIPKDGFDKRTGGFSKGCLETRKKLMKLQLSNQAVWDREHAREAEGGGVKSPWLVRGVYLSLCVFLDLFYENRPLQRFWFLETVARMPYFSYITMLHLYESLGWWRAGAEVRKVHFAEEWNELHHLQIMESLGGDQLWVDRFMAYHAAVVYYFILCAIFVFSPQLAYNFSELIEAHAVDTYGEFADSNKELLETIPPPLVAAQYYASEDLYMFDEFQTSRVNEPRNPPCNNLYDVFCNIRDDEGEHVKTMCACQHATIEGDLEERRETGRRI